MITIIFYRKIKIDIIMAEHHEVVLQKYFMTPSDCFDSTWRRAGEGV